MVVYAPEKDYDVPDVDLLTFLFESPLVYLKEDGLAHVEAVQPDNHLTKAQFRTATKRLAHLLRHKFGVGAQGPGKDVVVCMSSGQIFAPVLFLSVIAAGGVYSAASYTFTPGELARQIKQGSSNLIFTSEDSKETALEAAKDCGVPSDRVLVLQSNGGKRDLRDMTGRGENYMQRTAEMEWERITDPKVLAERAICLLYSSGTTGPPKGVHMSHRNMVSEGIIPQFVYREYFNARQAQDPSWSFNYSTLGHLPVAHVAGCQGYFVNPIIAGGPVYWMPRFDFPLFLQHIKKYKISTIFTVPPIYLLIAKSGLVTDQLESIEHAVTGAAPMGPELKAMAEQKLGCKRIGQTWGMSETTGSITIMPFDGHDPTSGISPVLANCRMRIVDEDCRDVKEGEEGEFLVKGPVVTHGYWENPTATRESFTPDGWFRSGDIGVCKDGKFYIVDRKKEMIKYNALQVAPAELEAHLISHPSILDAAVIGVPDPSGSGNELPRAYVVVDPKHRDTTASEEEIKRFVRENLAKHKQLRGGVVYLDAIPKSASGKILRRVLRDTAKSEMAKGKAKL